MGEIIKTCNNYTKISQNNTIFNFVSLNCCLMGLVVVS